MPGEDYARVGVITSRLYRPWFGVSISEVIPRTVNKIAVLEQIKRKTTRWGPLFLELLTCLRMGPNAKEAPAIVGHQLGFITPDTSSQAVRGVVQNLRSQSPVQNLFVGLLDVPGDSLAEHQIRQPAVETAYLKILDQLFGKRLHVANSLDKPSVGIPSTISASPEYGYGSLLARIERRREFITKVERLARSNDFTTRTPCEWLLQWLLVADDGVKCAALIDGIIPRLLVDGSPAAYELLSDEDLFQKESHWLVGSDSWAYDLGNSGVHHVIASGDNINMLVIDSQSYSSCAAADDSRRKKDIGLYAMNFGTAFVASVAVYSSYTQVLHAMIEADKFDGPSVVMAYLPYNKENDSPLSILQETKRAVDIGYWPLYRWDPNGEEKGGLNFALDSEHLRNELKEFLKRDNQLSQLVKRHPEFASNLSGSYGTEVRHQQKRKAKDAFSKLLAGLSGPPLTIIFASDGGNAEALAKRLGRRGKARGLKALVLSMEDYPTEDLPAEENLVLITSTAGQGEFPQNGRGFWETVKSSTDLDLAVVNYSVFALGDSHYWPRKQDKHYYNKPGKDLDKRLADLGGKKLVDIGLGDDQDPDAYQTAYSEWEPKLWKALGVDDVGGLPDEPPPITNEDIKLASNFLRGTIAEGLRDESTGAISASDQQLTKFHGTYMQDDRDLREERKAQGMEPAYSFMIRCRLPSGVATPDQWIKMDDISTNFGNGTMKLTTRQTFQVCPPILACI
jgi:sulfite reductase (NADPH) hemoprotein beta-component